VLKLNWVRGFGWAEGWKICLKMSKKPAPKTGDRGRQVGAFCKIRPRDTGIPFIFWPFLRFFHYFDRFRGWCNTTPVWRDRWGIYRPRLAGVWWSVVECA